MSTCFSLEGKAALVTGATICFNDSNQELVDRGIAAVLINSGTADFVITGCAPGDGGYPKERVVP